MGEVLTPLMTCVISSFLWTLVRLGAAYYLVVLEGGKKVYPLLRQYLGIKQEKINIE